MTDRSPHPSRQIKTYPTRSLREYLAHRSVFETENREQSIETTFQIELDIGDGRKQTLAISAATDVTHEAQQFCKRHNLEPFVQELLAESIRDLYQREATQRKNQRQAEIVEELHQIYSNSRTYEVLLRDSPERKHQTAFEAQKEVQLQQDRASTLKSTDRGEKNKENKPTINAVSRLICDKYGKSNIIQSRNKRSRQRLQALKKQKIAKQALDLLECKFQPSINTISHKVDQQLRQSSVRLDKKKQRYELLYNNFQEIQQKKSQLKEKAQAELTFRPNINFISKKIVEGRRILPQTNHLQHTHNHCHQQEHSNRPKTGRKPLVRNTAGLPIGEYLYQQGRRHSKPQVQMSCQVKALQHSDFLVSILKQKKIKEIFIDLSQPPHEKITPQDIPPYQDIISSPLRLMYPLFNEIQSLGVSLSQEDFLEAGLCLINSLTPNEKHELISKKQSDTIEMSYGSSQSKVFLRQSSGDLYTRGLVKNKQRQNRLQRGRQAKARQELKICTFRPALRR